MTTVELLQQLGLNKYEAEAYHTLLTRGALTGYELGKNSQVPLSRSYEILERLTARGLALVQPGDPPRYKAQEPQQFLGQFRTSMEATLSALTAALNSLASSATDTGEFWIVRGRQHILERTQAMIASAQSTLALSIPSDCQDFLAPALTEAQQRGNSISQYAVEPGEQQILLALSDEQEALLGTLIPTSTCQAVVSTNTALITTLHGYFLYQRFSGLPTILPAVPSVQPQNDDWLDWEERKQRRLKKIISTHRVA